MACDVLEQQDQTDPADDTARDSQSRGLPACGEHCQEKQRSKPDDNDGPGKAPIQRPQKPAYQCHQTEENQNHACDESAGIRAICLHTTFLSNSAAEPSLYV